MYLSMELFMHSNAALGSSCGVIMQWLHGTWAICGGGFVIHEAVYYCILHTAALQESFTSGLHRLQGNTCHAARLLHRHSPLDGPDSMPWPKKKRVI
jgi:hypothetical protein